jgi:RimJ/RimL family protein N-acetyltransferase
MKKMEVIMTYYKKLAGEKCYLSPVSLEDAEKWTEWDNDLEVAIPLGEESYTLYPLDKTKEIISNVIKKQDPIFSIIDLQTERPIGRCMLFNVDKVDRKAMLGIGIGEKTYWNKGYGQDATKLLLDYGFNLLNLNNIILGVYSYNKRAINCYKKIGFKEIGRRRKSKIIGGKFFDEVLMDILAEEFQSVCVSKFIEREIK